MWAGTGGTSRHARVSIFQDSPCAHSRRGGGSKANRRLTRMQAFFLWRPSGHSGLALSADNVWGTKYTRVCRAQPNSAKVPSKLCIAHRSVARLILKKRSNFDLFFIIS